MTARWASSMLAAMNGSPITLILRIDAGDGHVAGHVVDMTGRLVPFAGRIGLMCAIDAFVPDGGGPRQPAAEPPTQKEPK